MLPPVAPVAPAAPFLEPTSLETNFKRPLTRLINKQKNTVEIILKTKEDELINETSLPDRLTKLLPNIDDVIEEEDKDKTN